MGADLCLACISIKNYPKNKPKVFHLHGIKNQIRFRTRIMLQSLEEKGVMDKYQWEELYNFISGDSPPEDEKEMIKDAIEIINNFSECFNGRDVVVLKYPERSILLSGGMSWGDSPTDSYDIISKFSMLPEWLLSIGGFE